MYKTAIIDSLTPNKHAFYCFLLEDAPLVHQWTYSGQCPHTLGDWAWVPFRNHCYAFNLHSLKLQQEAHLSCKKGEEPHFSRELRSPFCVSLTELTALNGMPPVEFTFLFFFMLSVGAELLSILDETENGFIWEHIQSYAEQAYGAWLGISVKGHAVCSHTLLSSSVCN